MKDRQSLQHKRGNWLAEMENICEAAELRGAPLTATETQQFDSCRRQIDLIDHQLDELPAVEQRALPGPEGLRPLPITPDEALLSGVPALAGARVASNLPKGIAFTRYATALAMSKGNLHLALEVAQHRWRDSPEVGRVLKAAVASGTTTDPAWAQPLAEYV